MLLEIMSEVCTHDFMALEYAPQQNGCVVFRCILNQAAGRMEVFEDLFDLARTQLPKVFFQKERAHFVFNVRGIDK